MIEKRLSQIELADLLGLSTRQVSNLVALGMPQHGDRGKRWYVWRGCHQWYVSFKVEEGKREVKPSTINEAKLRRETAEAELKELELAERRGDLMTVEAGERVIAQAFARASSKLANLETAIAMRVTGLTVGERQNQARGLVDEVRAELAADEAA
jgi:phage terminase Nu1 subunit (DNA packaging protein)